MSIKIFIKLAAAISLLLFSRLSIADCSNSGGYQNWNINFGNVYVQRDTPAGTVVATTTAHGNVYFGCSTSWVYRWVVQLFTQETAFSSVYNTNVNGIGIKLYSNNWAMPFDYTYNANTYVAGDIEVKAELIKIIASGVAAGPLNTGVAAKLSIANVMDTGQVNLTGGVIYPVACSINTPALNFPIGDVLAAKFGSSVGTLPAGAQNTQNLGLNCDAGANINVTLQGTQNPDVSTASVLALTGQGNADVAGGVGVQLLYNGTPLELNKRIVLKQSAGGQETFPLTARYYQTKTTVTTGKANTTATLDLTYQ